MQSRSLALVCALQPFPSDWDDEPSALSRSFRSVRSIVLRVHEFLLVVRSCAHHSNWLSGEAAHLSPEPLDSTVTAIAEACSR